MAGEFFLKAGGEMQIKHEQNIKDKIMNFHDTISDLKLIIETDIKLPVDCDVIDIVNCFNQLENVKDIFNKAKIELVHIIHINNMVSEHENGK